MVFDQSTLTLKEVQGHSMTQQDVQQGKISISEHGSNNHFPSSSSGGSRSVGGRNTSVNCKVRGCKENHNRHYCSNCKDKDSSHFRENCRKYGTFCWWV